MTKRIGILTAGPDVPGQNVCLKAIVHSGADLGFEVVGIRKGWEGLLHLNPDDRATHAENAMVLTKARVRDIDRAPGSFLHTSRVIPGSVPVDRAPEFLRPPHPNGKPLDLSGHVQRAIERLDLEALIVMGHRAGLQYAARLSQEGVPLVGIPASAENDINGSEYSLGFSTGLSSGVHRVHEIRAMAGSREEIAVVEMFGRKYGLFTMLVAVLAGADRLLIPETPFAPERLAALLLEDKRAAPANYAILAMSESVTIEPPAAPERAAELRRRLAAEASPGGNNWEAGPLTMAGERQVGLGAGGSGAVVTELLEDLLGERMVFQPLNYLLRVGLPDGQDLLGAANFATLAVNLAASGRTGRLAAYRRGVNYVDLPITVVTEPDEKADVADWYDPATYRARPDVLWAARV